MPSLILWGKPTVFAGDDLRMFAVGAILLRVLELALAVVLLGLVFQQESYELEHKELQQTEEEEDDPDDDQWFPIVCPEGYYYNVVPEDDKQNTTSPFSSSSSSSSAFFDDETTIIRFHGRILSHIYAASLITVSVASISMLLVLRFVSGQGTPTQPERRNQALYPLCHFRLSILNMISVISFILGLFALFNMVEYCDSVWYQCSLEEEIQQPQQLLENSSTNTTTIPVTATTDDSITTTRDDACPNLNTWWYVLLTLLVFHGVGVGAINGHLLYMFPCRTRSTSKIAEDGDDDDENDENAKVTTPDGSWWRRFFHCCCGLSSLLTCCIFGGSEVARFGDFSDFAMALADYFHHNGILDVTASDVVAGLLLVRRVQQEDILAHRQQIMKALVERKRLQLQDVEDEFGEADEIEVEFLNDEVPSRPRRRGRTKERESSESPTNDHRKARLMASSSRSRSRSQDLCIDGKVRSSSVGGRSRSPSSSSLISGSSSSIHGQTGTSKIRNESSRITINSARRAKMLQANSSNLDNRASWSHSLSSRGAILQELLGQDPLFRPMFRNILNLQEHTRDRYMIAEGARFMAIAQGMYSWVIYLMEHPVIGCVDLSWRSAISCGCCCYCCCCNTCCCSTDSRRRRRDIEGEVEDEEEDNCGSNAQDEDEANNTHHGHSHGNTIEHDNRCQANLVALQAISGLKIEDIVYAQFEQGIEIKPYVIALDHEWKSVVLAIRGTLSLEDMLADVMVRPRELDDLGEKLGFDGKGKYCHSGMLASAKWIYHDLKRHGKLDKLLLGDNAEYGSYRLRVIGHSLGAGCAATLSLLLRPKYPKVRCLAFSPPGCVFSANLASECGEWTTSYVLDADIVPRLSIQSFEALRHEVLEMICRIKIPKYEVLQYRRQKGLKDMEALAEANSRTLYDKDDVPETRFHQQVKEFFEYQATVVKEKRSPNDLYVAELFCPGKIINLFRTEEKARFLKGLSEQPGESAGSSGNINLQQSRMESSSNFTSSTRNDNDNLYTARWAERDDLRKIILSKHSLTDHDPIRAKRELRRMAEHIGLKPPYSNVLVDYA